MSKVYNANESKFKRKVDDFVWEVKTKTRKTADWIIKNKELVILVGPTIVAGVSFITKHTIKAINLNKQERVKNLYCYDRSLGHYWKLRRELTNDEWVYIDKRKAKGERLADILEEMKVLK